jgi:hypothetical protein
VADEIKVEQTVVEGERKVREVIELGSSNFNVLNIGFGQGGCKLAFVIASKFNIDDVFYFNTSARDIEGLENASLKTNYFKIGGDEVEGAGKERETSQIILEHYYEKIVEIVRNLASKKRFDFIFVSFSTSGGTGSGMGPNITAMLNSNEFLDSLKGYDSGKKPIVFGIAITPEISDLEGTRSLKNTLLCLDNINKFVNTPNGSIARYLLVTNGAQSVRNSEVKKQSTQHSMINKAVADTLFRYLKKYGHTKLSNLDREDRIKSLEAMGLHSFSSFVPVGEGYNREYNTNLMPFIIPEGERVRLVTYEVDEEEESVIIEYFKDSGLIVDDYIHGYYDRKWPPNKEFESIIGFHGYRNVAKISERFADRLRKISLDEIKREKENISAARGLDNVRESARLVREEYGKRHGMSFADIFATGGSEQKINKAEEEKGE